MNIIAQQIGTARIRILETKHFITLDRVLILLQIYLELVTYAESRDTCSLTAQLDELNSTTKKDYEYSKKLDICVKGRLKNNILFWKNDLKASQYILDIITDGYVIPLIQHPPSFYAKNNKSSLKHQNFVDEAIHNLLQNNCIEELTSRPYCCNPLTVAENNTKLRLVLDLRHVNEFVKYTKFKYEDLNTFAKIFDKNDFFTTFDLKSGYHHVDIHPEHRKFLGFEWTFSNGVTRYFQFAVLPFGLTSACYAFTKILRHFISKWRGVGIKSVIYLDDGINGHTSYDKAKYACKFVVNGGKGK